ncbi:unnamed protein product [Caenorhabditis auriculariae]|uniref:MARVEL domain-containing protein n=1 Tax=Caenorhabditis auriculariae TaxID=2777116 RepID=A0A8S1GM30_9PELO|nr:unnamed protein product [Caenorhabditis auriculariae]
MEFGLGTAGTVKIIPATAFRDVSAAYHQQHQYDPSYPQEAHGYGHPINAAYYMGGVYNPGYLHEPYGHNVYIDAQSYGEQQQQQQSYPYYGYNYSPYAYAPPTASAYPGAYGPYPGASGAYRPYPQPQPSSPRRSRTAPSRPRSTVPTSTAHGEGRRSRGISAEAFDRRQYKAYSGPAKKPLPIYRKRREPTSSRYQETDFGGGTGMDYGGGATFAPYNRNYYNEQVTTLRRLRPFYAPSYTTYPPSTMHRKQKMNTKRYPTFARMALKAAQLILGAAVIGLVLGPMKGNSFHQFVIQTSTEWQGLVLGIAVTFSIFSGILLLTSYLANDVHIWRKVDALLTAAGCFCWLLAGFVEAYFAACYPPNGARINLVCHRAEWIIACILCFINLVIFVADFVMSWMAGVTIL